MLIVFFTTLLINVAIAYPADYVGVVESELCEGCYSTGFVAEHGIVVPYHFTRSKCTTDQCYLRFKNSNLQCTKTRLKFKSSTADLAVLSCESNELPRGFKMPSDFNFKLRKGKVTILYSDSQGKIHEARGRIKWSSRFLSIISTRLTFGSSGAVVLDSNNKVYGIVVRAESAIQGLIGKLLPWHKFSVKAVNAKYVGLLRKKDRRLPASMAYDLMSYYREIVRNHTKFDRLLESLEFTRLVNNLSFDFHEPLAHVMTLRENPFDQKATLKDSFFFPLILAYHLERFGNLDVKNTILPPEAQELVTVFEGQKFFGQQLFYLGVIVLILIWFTFAVFVALVLSYAKLKQAGEKSHLHP
ncbi:MAG: serine protease [Deltaproteobacteria bacterium]|nr:serine protease [Deltaproteobacteria bacterium]